MGVSAATFNSAGQSSSHYIPGAYSRRSTVGAGSGVSSGNLCIIGTSTGGKPLTLHAVSDKAEAKALLVGGPLLEAVAQAFNGSTTYIPQRVYCMRVNAGTQSSRTLKNGSTSVLTVRSADYGAHMNQLKLWLKAGTTGKMVLANYKGSEVKIDNIAKKSFAVLYVGDGESAACTINATGLTITTDVSDDNLSVTWEDCETIEELVAKINDAGVYSATLIDTTPNTPTRQLDHVANVSVIGTAATFSSDLQALVEALERVQYIGAGNVSLSGTSRLVPDDDDGYEYFSGADAGTSTVTDWDNAINLLEKEDVQIIATPETDGDICSLIAEHCAVMSSVSKKRERTCWLGTAKGVSIDNAIAQAKGYNNEFVSLVCTSAVANNPFSGASEEIAPALLACKCAGVESAIGVSNPLTNKAIKVSAFGAKYSPSELEKMIANGLVTFGENDDGELVCIRSITTYQGDSLVLNERSMLRSVLYMDRDLRKAFSRGIGSNDEPSESSIIQTLENKAKKWYADGLLTRNGANLYENAKVRFDGDKIFLSFDRYIRAPKNFVFITATNKVYSSTVEL